MADPTDDQLEAAFPHQNDLTDDQLAAWRAQARIGWDLITLDDDDG